jgi:hypothetical protein
VHRRYWHALDIGEKLELLSNAESNADRPRYIELDVEMIRKICLAVESAVEAEDNFSAVLEHFQLAGYGTNEVSDQICLLHNSGFIEAEQIGTEMKYRLRRLTAK